MGDFVKVAGQLGPYALFTVVMFYMVLQWGKTKRAIGNGSASFTCKAPAFDAALLIKRLNEVHGVIMREDDEGVKLVYARHRALEQAIIQLSNCTEAQTKVLQSIYEEARDTRRDVERLENKLTARGCAS